MQLEENSMVVAYKNIDFIPHYALALKVCKRWADMRLGKRISQYASPLIVTADHVVLMCLFYATDS
jgi:hypothetical protein